MTAPKSKGSSDEWIEKLGPAERELLALLTPVELEALRRNGEEVRRFAIAESGLDDDASPGTATA